MRCEHNTPFVIALRGSEAVRHLGPLLRLLGLLVSGLLFLHGSARADDTSNRPAVSDSANAHPTYRLTPIAVTADRITPELQLRELPGQTSWLDVQPFQLEITNTASILDQLPGLHIQNFGSIGHVATASIRGTSASQVTVYLDGIPLTRAGAGLMNLAELPFAGVHHIEVYRGFAPASLPGASMGGAINLVSATRPPRSPNKGQPGVRASSLVRLGAGSLDTRRLGFSHQLHGADWDALVAVDAMQSDGDFEFFDDRKTDLTPSDDRVVARQNNWLRSQEILTRFSAPIQGTRLTFSNQWIDRKEGIAGRYEAQATSAQSSLTHNLTNVHFQFPALGQDRLLPSLRFFYDWRRDNFRDPNAEITFRRNLEFKDTTQAFGTQILLESRVPVLQSLTALIHLRQELFDPGRALNPEHEVQQSRSLAELALGNRWSTRSGRLGLQGTLRLTSENDHFTGDLDKSASASTAKLSERQFVEPQFGLRLQLLRGVYAEASFGEYHRTPTFMELFGESGSISANPQLLPEEGINRDLGLEWSARARHLTWHFEAAHFQNRVDHMIVFVVQGQRRFIARNIGSARLQGEEYSWNVGLGGQRRRLNLQGNVTRQGASDLGVDTPVYTGKVLPGRPETQVFARLTLGWSRFDVSWQFEHVGLNYLDRWNALFVPQRSRHGLDVSVRVSHLRCKAVVRNLADDRQVDVRDSPLPGRTYSLMTELTF